MIGRYARGGALAELGTLKLAQVGGAGALIAGAAISHYAFSGPPWLMIGLCCASLALTGFPIVWEALKGLLRLETNVDELVSIAIVASVILGEWISAAVVALIMVLGSLIEEATSERARRHLEALTEANPRTAWLLDGDGGEAREVDVASLEPGQRVLVRPGDVVPADGTVEEGQSEVDESMLTGESLPLGKQPNDAVASGTINIDGSLTVRVSRVGDDSTHGRIQRLVQEAERHRAPILREAERYARWFTPAILLLAGLVWWLTGDVHRGVTMLIVGCPCAFVLATPTAVVAALGRASKSGILIKGGRYLEACAHVSEVVFDKTGTLTTGSFVVDRVVSFGELTEDALLTRAARLEAASEHPLALAIVVAARARGFTVEPLGCRRLAGRGVIEAGEGPSWSAGNARLMDELKLPLPHEAVEQARAAGASGETVIYVARGEQLEGLITLRDETRPEVPDVLRGLASQGFARPMILTGDSAVAAQRAAEHLLIAPQSVRAELLPDDKLDEIQRLEAAGRRVCYVGDGTNDGPALAAASVGVSIGSRSNTVALETAHAVLMRGDLRGLPMLLRLGRATARTINQNLILFGLIFNASMIALSAAGALTPILGALGHNVGSVAVVLNSARLLAFERG